MLRYGLRLLVFLSLTFVSFGQTPRLKLPPLRFNLNAARIQGPSSGVSPSSPQQPVTLTLQDALARARTSSQAYLSAAASASLAREDRIQAKAALLPNVQVLNQFIYTQASGTDVPVFVGADGVHVYINQLNVHDETFSMTKRLEYRRALAAEAVARARQDVALRGLTGSVVQGYYAFVSAQRKLANAQQSLDAAKNFLDITQRLEAGGEVARSDVIKARILVEQRQRDVGESELAIDKARIALAVFLFPDFNQDFSVVDDLATVSVLAPLQQIQNLATQSSPGLRAAQGTLTQETHGVAVAKSGFLPTLSFDYFYGIQANQFAVRTHEHKNLGSSVVATLTVPVFNFGATRSKIRQARLHQQQAELDLALTRKELASNLNALYREAQVSRAVLDSLKTSLDLATESLRLTLLRYQAGEVGVLEVVDAQTTLTDSRRAYDEGLARYRTVWTNLEVLAGNF